MVVLPRRSRAARAAACALAIVLLPAAPAAARTLTVNDRGDHPPGACTPADCTLREAVIAANNRGADTILLPSRKTYTLAIKSTGEDAAANGDLDITSGPLTVAHRGKGTATIDANRTDRIFDIGEARTRLEKLTIRGGRAHPLDAGGDGGGIAAGDLGDAPVLVLRSRIIDNQTPTVDGNGGGIDTDIDGLFRIVDSTVARNDAGGDGGGISGSVEGIVQIKGTTITGNEAGEGGGVMVVGPPTAIVSSTIAFNRAVGGGDGEIGDGAGIYVDDEGFLSLTNSTVTLNRAIENGGGIFGETGGKAKIVAATIARNVADSDGADGGQSGGIHLDAASFSVANSIVALNSAGGDPADCGGATFIGSAPNLITSGGCGSGPEIAAADPMLGALGRNGGLTATIPLLGGSPAIGAADPALAPAKDQRGRARSDPDLGAFER